MAITCHKVMDGATTTRPNPDPTSLTTDQLHREMQLVRETLDDHIETERVHQAERKELFIKLFESGDKLMNQRIDGVIREMNLQSTTAATAIAKSEAGYEKRFEIQNEFRAQVNDQAARFVTDAEYRTAHKAVEDSITKLTDRFNLREGRETGKDGSKSELRANITGAVGVLVGLITMFFFLSNLNSRVDRNSDRVTQTQTQPGKTTQP